MLDPCANGERSSNRLSFLWIGSIDHHSLLIAISSSSPIDPTSFVSATKIPICLLVVNPGKEVGRVTLITRFGAEKVGRSSLDVSFDFLQRLVEV